MIDMSKFTDRVDTEEAAKILGLKPQTLVTWRHQGKTEPAYLKIGSRVFYPRTALLHFLEKNFVGGEHE